MTFAKQVECAFWKERCGKRNAKVIYVFDDGFDSFDKVKKALADHDCNVIIFDMSNFVIIGLLYMFLVIEDV